MRFGDLCRFLNIACSHFSYLEKYHEVVRWQEASETIPHNDFVDKWHPPSTLGIGGRESREYEQLSSIHLDTEPSRDSVCLASFRPGLGWKARPFGAKFVQ